MSKESATAMLTETTATPPQVVNGAADTATQNPVDSTRFASLAKKESDFFKKQEQYKAERAQFEADKKKYLDAHDRVTKFEELKKVNPREAIKFAGLSDTDILNLFADLEDISTPEEKAAKAAQNEINKFKEEQSRAAQAEQSKRNESAIRQFKSQITNTIEGDKERFEYCNFHGPIAEELILETVSTVLERDKQLISAKEAAEMVESFYEEQDKLMSNLNKRKPKEQAVQEAKEQLQQLKPELPGRSMPKTLSNKAAASIAGTTVPVKETRDQKRQRLIETLGNLGKK